LLIEEKSILVVPLMGFSGSQEGIAPSNPCSGEMSKIPEALGRKPAPVLCE
jgi:hypothetical protein